MHNGVVDAYTRVMEQFLNFPVGERVQDRFAEGLPQTLIEIDPKVLQNPQDYNIQANIMWVATLALRLLASKLPSKIPPLFSRVSVCLRAYS